MSNYFPAVWNELNSTILAVWPDIEINFRSTQSERIPWRDFVRKALANIEGGVKPPYAIVHLGPYTPDPTWGMSNITYRMPIDIYRIEYTNTEDGVARTDVAADVEAQLALLRDRLRTSQFTNFQIIEDPLVDSSAMNPANQAFSAGQYPFFGGFVGVKPLIGETI